MSVQTGSQTFTPLRILRLPGVKERIGLGKSYIYQKIKEGTFPRPVSLGVDRRAVGWLEHEIDTWILDCIKQRDGAA